MALNTAAFSPPGVSSAPEVHGVKPFKFIQLCDPQFGYGGYEHDAKAFKQAVTKINQVKPDFVVICGDLVNSCTEKAFEDFTKIREHLTVPCYCAPGNHDIGDDSTRESLEYYRKVIGKDYYSFDHNGCVFVIVNTQIWKTHVDGESSTHDVWLKDTLLTATNKNAPVFVIGHHPFFLEDLDEKEEHFNLPAAKRKEMLKLFEEVSVVAMLGGHTHKLLVNEYKDIQLVNAETTSKNKDGRPLGFRIWSVMGSRNFKHKLVALQ